MTKEKKFKRLFFDIETSYNVVSCWSTGNKISVSPDNIIKERAIICICWKYDDEKTVNYLTWNKGDDKQMLVKFAKIMNEADEIIGHNSDSFDTKWIRTRCLKHGIPLVPVFKSIDTLKLSRKGFRFNSNKLDYLGKFLGFGGKKDTGGLSLWNDIIFNNDKKSMEKMVAYCQKDVVLLEQIYNKLSPYIVHTTSKTISKGGSICDCPSCSSKRTISNGARMTATGLLKRRLQCKECGAYFSISEAQYIKNN